MSCLQKCERNLNNCEDDAYEDGWLHFAEGSSLGLMSCNLPGMAAGFVGGALWGGIGYNVDMRRCKRDNADCKDDCNG